MLGDRMPLSTMSFRCMALGFRNLLSPSYLRMFHWAYFSVKSACYEAIIFRFCVTPFGVYFPFLPFPIFVVAISCDPLAPILIGVLYLDDVLGCFIFVSISSGRCHPFGMNISKFFFGWWHPLISIYGCLPLSNAYLFIHDYMHICL